ncbi:TonB-dependent receptor [Tenacibaculum finnmarkense]|uniref:TonB-dependent receptor n=1 Tax=Tenacibaculum finnmarkense TaxID=2781243 RepID=UPI00187B2CF9|nr:TonB-dependent receptor [Tenacibaculum finnmarkense]MBE7659756.1 TonB-dependent receptor [Tenacibaculum finnmarkense genomovar finnmarkense]MCG8250792.1 TonB-dependent receptor [Tenacibaculum finnmarkense genomovar finnmarkense]MCG8814616.1 TonB-dependent receptor [Tenacibaculum finnmarkense]MCG8819635.1 TonB-dependent receptor [Tenacibaculum finnmarkense]
MSFIQQLKSIAFIIILCSSFAVNAQSFILSGKIINNNQEPLNGASIVLKNSKKGVSSDKKGNFKLNLSKGTHLLEVSYIGFKTTIKQIELTNNQQITIQLSEEKNVLDAVLVNAVRVQENAPVTHSNVSKKQLEKRNLGQDIPVLLNYLPNVVSSSDAGAGVGYTYMSVRGSDATRVNVTINGIPYNDSESQGSYWVNLGDFASSTQSLQLQRGVGTSTNGAGAFGASLNILTDAISEKAGGEISNAFGSYGTRKHTVKFTTGKINEHFELAGRLSNIYSDGYIDRASTDLKSYFLQASYTNKNTLIKAISFGGKEETYQAWDGISAKQLKQDRRQNPLTYDNEVDNYKQDHYQLHWNEKVSQNWTTNFGLNYTKGKGYFEQFKGGTDKISLYNGIIVATDTYKNYKDEIIPITDVIVRRWLDNDFYVANFNATYNNDKLEIISGGSYSYYENEHFGEVIWAKEFADNANIRDRYYDGTSTKKDANIFTKISFNITDDLRAFADLQGRFISYKTNGLTSKRKPLNVDKNFNFFNPKIGFTYTLNNQNSFYTSFARANREPNRSDFKGGVTTHESLNDYELGWRLKTKTIKLNTNIYFMDYQNQLVLTGEIDDTGDALRSASGNSYRVGVEMDANIRVNDKFSIGQNVSVSQNKNVDFFTNRNDKLQELGNTNIANSPNIVTGNSLTYQASENLQLAFLSKFVGEQYLSNTDTEASKLSNYFTSDFNIMYELKTKSIFKSIVFTGVVNNVFDKQYVDRGYIYLDTWSKAGTTTEIQGYYPQATINFLAGVTFKF